MSEILPCPFCGGAAEIIDIDDGDNSGGSCIGCSECQASGNVEFGRKENFVGNWNRRQSVPVWQPIETAPKDGSTIIVAAYCDETSTVGEAYWPEAGEWFWWHSQEYPLSENGFEAMFWQPLPSPPKPSPEPLP